MAQRVIFCLGAAVLPWLAAAFTTVGFLWATGGLEYVPGIFSIGFVQQPLVVFVALACVVAARGTSRLRPVFTQFWAVGGVVALVSAVVSSVYATVLDPSFGFSQATIWGMFSGYWLYAFFAGALLWRRSAPAETPVA